MSKTIQKNDIFPLEITGLTAEGSGVGRHSGMAVFVAAAVPGDVLNVRIIKVSRNYAVGIIQQIITPGEGRIPVDCRVNSSCGGCSYRQMSYETELREKHRRVQDALDRIGHIQAPVEPILHLDCPDHYRNKAQYPVGMVHGALHIGFYAPRSHRIVDCRDCLLQPPEFAQGLEAFAKWITENRISIYEAAQHKGLVRHLYLRKAFGTGELMACVVINGKALPCADYLVGCLQNALPGLKSVAVNYNTEKTNVILGRRTDILWGSETITDLLLGCRFQISPNSFYQVNHDGAELLYRKAAQYAALTGEQTLLDLYCGTGTIGLTMADKVQQLIGVEIIPDAVENAKANAALNGISNARFLCAGAAGAADALAREGIRPDVVLLDPPRKGCEPGLIDTIHRMSPGRVVYVSCDPATLARDLALFAQCGYETLQVTPVDMFPRTPHVESVVLMSKKQ